MLTELGLLMRWLAETVHTGDWANEWFYELIAWEISAEELLSVIGEQILSIFG